MPEKQYFGTRTLSEMTGYHQKTLQDLAAREYAKPEADRRIDVYKDSDRYLIRYGSLLEYMKSTGYQGKVKT